MGSCWASSYYSYLFTYCSSILRLILLLFVHVVLILICWYYVLVCVYVNCSYSSSKSCSLTGDEGLEIVAVNFRLEPSCFYRELVRKVHVLRCKPGTPKYPT